MKFYQYPKCSTCRKALKFLQSHNIEVEVFDISQTPPSKDELQLMLKHIGELKKLFNTSGMQYRELNMKEKLPNMSDAEAIELLSGNGMLIKRPFLLFKEVGLLGFKEDTWLEVLK